jgi:hypothetical protein
MQKKTFSVKDGSIVIEGGNIHLYDKGYVATTEIINRKLYSSSLHQLSSTLIRTPKTDEELAEKYSKCRLNGRYFKNDSEIEQSCYSLSTESFLAGLKARGGEYSKEDMISFAKWLQKEDTETNAESWFHYTDSDMFEYWLKEVHSKAIYPHTITVEHDVEKYYWETIKAEY